MMKSKVLHGVDCFSLGIIVVVENGCKLWENEYLFPFPIYQLYFLEMYYLDTHILCACVWVNFVQFFQPLYSPFLLTHQQEPGDLAMILH